MNLEHIEQFGVPNALPALSGFVVGIFLRGFVKGTVIVSAIVAILVLGLLMVEETNHRPSVFETLGVIRRPSVFQNFAVLAMTFARYVAEQLRTLPGSSLVGFAVGVVLHIVNALRRPKKPLNEGGSDKPQTA